MRLLVDSPISHGSVMTHDPGIACEPARAVLRIAIGDRIALNADDFDALCAAFLAEIEHRYPG